MRLRSLRKWDDVAGSVGLVFFAQMLDELLFDYTLDTYKPSAMNTALLAKEAASVIKAIESGVIMKPNLDHVLRELCSNLSKDQVAKSMLSVDVAGVISSLNQGASVANASVVIDILRKQMPLNLYKGRNEQMLVEEIVGQKRFSEIRALTRSYITTLLNFGYSTKFLAKMVQDFFFYSSDRISDSGAIREFLEIFSKDADVYDVIYKGPSYLLGFKESASRLGVEVSKELESYLEITDKYSFKVGAGEVYLLLPGHEARDPYFLKSRVGTQIDLLQTLIGLYHHKESPRSVIDCLVVNKRTGDALKSTQTLHPMHKCKDLKVGPAAKRLAEFMKGFSMRKESFRKFNRSAELHALALSSDSVENQMINLWISLESLIPNKSDSGKASIEHVTSSVLAFLSIGYINKIILSLSKDLIRWNSSAVKRAVKSIYSDRVVTRITHLLVLDKYGAERAELESEFGDFLLLKERYQYVRNLLVSPAEVLRTLENHEERVSWQIRRIYRARNLIVHEGMTPSYTDVLIENIHDYLDVVLNGLMNLASDGRISTIDQGFKLVELNYGAYKAALRCKGLRFEEGNLDDLLFKYLI